jgi:hypothetical protein
MWIACRKQIWWGDIVKSGHLEDQEGDWEVAIKLDLMNLLYFMRMFEED